jgi:transporter family protein
MLPFWPLAAALAAAILAAVNVADKHVVTRLTKSVAFMLSIDALVGLAFALAILLFRGFDPLSSVNVFLGLLAGAFFVIHAWYYFEALKAEEVSRVIPILYLDTLFIAAFAFLFLGETLKPVRYLGAALLVAGAIVLSIHSLKEMRFVKAKKYLLASLLFSAAYVVTMKYLLYFADALTVFSYTRFGAVLAMMVVAAFVGRTTLSREASAAGTRTTKIVTALAVASMASFLLITIAAETGPITAVSAILSTQALFVLVFAVLVGMTYPKALDEELKRTTLMQKVLGTLLILIGVALVK